MASTILHRRFENQRLLRSFRGRPEEIVAWFGAVQSQDFAGAKWGVGQRGTGLTDAAVGQAFDDGRILRTHVLRPTWHFVAPADIRWMLELTAPRLHRLNGVMYRRSGLDDKAFTSTRRAFDRALAGGRALTRAELAGALERAGIEADGHKLAYVVDRDAALAELARRYLQSHGPATIRDFVWWSGLTVRDATTAFDANGRSLEQESLGELRYWSVPGRTRPSASTKTVAYLFPNYDEFLIAYKDRGLVPAHPAPPAGVVRGDRYAHHLVIDGRLRGSWMRTVTTTDVRIDVAAYGRLRPNEREAVEAAAERCGRFMDLQPVVVIR